jgi:hypothetical protein
LFRALKKHSKGNCFTCDKEVQDAMAKWFWEQPKNFTMTGTKNLFSAGGVVLNKRGNIWKHETNYTVWAIFYALFLLNILSGCKYTNMEAKLLEHSLYAQNWTILPKKCQSCIGMPED